MPRMNYWAILVSALAAFALSFVWYSAFAEPMLRLHPGSPGTPAAMVRPTAWKMGAEVVRDLILAFVLARLVRGLGISTWTAGAGLAVLLWVGFPFVLWTGAIMWENVPLELAAIHAGDWLAKLLVIAMIVGAWRR
jgi:uncharacterized protein DUF1761